LRVGADLLDRNTADVVPGLALTTGAALHGVIDGVLGVVVVQLDLVEDSGRAIQLKLKLSSDSALEVDGPQRFLLADGNTLDLFNRK